MTIPPETAVRFVEKIGFTDHCWLWLGATAGRGYGVFHVPEAGMVYAHRVSHEGRRARLRRKQMAA